MCRWMSNLILLHSHVIKWSHILWQRFIIGRDASKHSSEIWISKGAQPCCGNYHRWDTLILKLFTGMSSVWSVDQYSVLSGRRKAACKSIDSWNNDHFLVNSLRSQGRFADECCTSRLQSVADFKAILQCCLFISPSVFSLLFPGTVHWSIFCELARSCSMLWVSSSCFFQWFFFIFFALTHMLTNDCSDFFIDEGKCRGFCGSISFVWQLFLQFRCEIPWWKTLIRHCCPVLKLKIVLFLFITPVVKSQTKWRHNVSTCVFEADVGMMLKNLQWFGWLVLCT